MLFYCININKSNTEGNYLEKVSKPCWHTSQSYRFWILPLPKWHNLLSAR